MRVSPVFLSHTALFLAGSILSSLSFAQISSMSIQESLVKDSTTSVVLDGHDVQNQIRVDGRSSSTISARGGLMTIATELRPVRLQLGVATLTRDIDDQRAGSETGKRTQMATPAVAWSPSSDTSILAGISIIQTKTHNDAVDSGAYDLDTRRAFLTFTRHDAVGMTRLRVASEARAEYAYSLYGYPMVDRDYVPLQVDLNREVQLDTAWKLDGGIRYSHYNGDVYADQHDSDVPKTPTLAQVFDYLLTFKAGVTYAVNDAFSVRSEFRRKAALDTDSYAGTEYLVGLAGGISGLFALGDSAAVAVGYETSSGEKTHEVQGQRYAYSDQRRELRAAVHKTLF